MELKNHKRDEHDMVEECTYFKKGRCKFENLCWNKHIGLEQTPPARTITKCLECYDCKELFTRLGDMMIHRKNKHPEKV